jgi:hypothetical protein
MRGEGGWGIIAAGVGLVAAASIAAVVLSSGDSDTSRVNAVNDTSLGAPLAPPLDPVRVTIASTLAPSTTVAVAATVATLETTTTPAPPPTVVTPPAPPPAQLAAAGTLLDLGIEGTAGSIVIGNSGGQPLDWVASSDNGLVTPTANGTLGPGQQTEVTISVSRNGLIEGDYEATVSVLGAGKAIPIAVRWRVDRAPVVHVTLDPPGLADAASCPAKAKDLTGTISASVIDESSVASVVMAWSGPGHGDSSPMTAGEPGTWSAPVGPLVGPGSWTVVVTATDARGNVGSGGTTFVVTACPTPTTT